MIRTKLLCAGLYYAVYGYLSRASPFLGTIRPHHVKSMSLGFAIDRVAFKPINKATGTTTVRFTKNGSLVPLKMKSLFGLIGAHMYAFIII